MTKLVLGKELKLRIRNVEENKIMGSYNFQIWIMKINRKNSCLETVKVKVYHSESENRKVSFLTQIERIMIYAS